MSIADDGTGRELFERRVRDKAEGHAENSALVAAEPFKPSRSCATCKARPNADATRGPDEPGPSLLHPEMRYFFAAARFFAGRRFAARFFVARFFAGAFLAALRLTAFFAAVFLTPFLAALRLTAFFAAVFLTPFLAALRLTAFFAAVFLTPFFLAGARFAAFFLAGARFFVAFFAGGTVTTLSMTVSPRWGFPRASGPAPRGDRVAISPTPGP